MMRMNRYTSSLFFVLAFTSVIGILSLNYNTQISFAGGDGSGWVKDRLVYPDLANEQRCPSIATDGNGYLYVAYEHYNSSTGYYEIWVSRSTNGGDSWNVVGVESDPNHNLQNPSIAIDVGDANHVFVTFERVWDINDHDVLVIRYIGGVWSKRNVLAEVGSDDRYPVIACEYWRSPDGHVYIAFEHIVSYDDRDIMLAESDDDGNNWYVSTLHGDTDSAVYAQPSISTDIERYLLVAYKYGTNYDSAYDVYLNVLDTSYSPPSSIWTDPDRLVYDGSSRDVQWPTVAATRVYRSYSNTIVVAWHVFYDSTHLNDIQYAYSTNRGGSWTMGWLSTETGTDEVFPVLTPDGRDTTTDTRGFFHLTYARNDKIIYKKADWDKADLWTSAQEIIDPEGSVSENYTRPAITAHSRGGTYYPNVVWTDYRGSNNDIYYSTPGATYNIASDPTGRVLEVDGVVHTAPVTFNWIAGYTHSIYARSPQYEGTDKRHIFLSWSDGGDQFHTLTTGTSDATITADFKTQYYVTVNQSGADVSIAAEIDGESWELPASFWWDHDSSHTISVPSEVMGSSGTRYVFVEWDDGYSGLSRVIVVTSPTVFLANYKTQHYLTMSTNLGSVSPESGWVNDGSNILIVATAPDDDYGERYLWKGWNGSGSGSYSGMENPVSILIQSSISQSASWLHQFNITTGVMTIGNSRLNATNGVTVSYTSGGTTNTASIWDDSSINIWADDSSIVSYTNSSSASNLNHRWQTTITPSYTVNRSTTYTEKFYEQFKCSITTSGLDPSKPSFINATKFGKEQSLTTSDTWSDWADAASILSITRVINVSTTERYYTSNTTQWLVQTSFSSSILYVRQYYLAVDTSPPDLVHQPTGERWYNENDSVQLTAPDVGGYQFEHWAVDGLSIGSNINPIDVRMDKPHTAVAYYVGLGWYFTISVSPTSQTVVPGGSTSYTVTVTGFGEKAAGKSIALSISGLPAGVNSQFSPSSVSSNHTSTLTISTSSFTEEDTYTLKVTATSGELTETATITLVVQAQGINLSRWLYVFIGIAITALIAGAVLLRKRQQTRKMSGSSPE